MKTFIAPLFFTISVVLVLFLGYEIMLQFHNLETFTFKSIGDQFFYSQSDFWSHFFIWAFFFLATFRLLKTFIYNPIKRFIDKKKEEQTPISAEDIIYWRNFRRIFWYVLCVLSLILIYDFTTHLTITVQGINTQTLYFIQKTYPWKEVNEVRACYTYTISHGKNTYGDRTVKPHYTLRFSDGKEIELWNLPANDKYEKTNAIIYANMQIQKNKPTLQHETQLITQDEAAKLRQKHVEWLSAKNWSDEKKRARESYDDTILEILPQCN